jgi:predicted MFS family arabinose efflux permease
MLNCIAGIIGSIWLGKYLDKYKCFKKLQIFNAVAISFFISITFAGLQLDFPNWLVLMIIIIAGAPMSSVSVVSYQFAAEVIYPIGEVQGVSLMNTLNKLISFSLVQLTNGLTVDKPNQIKYMYGFILWIALPLIGLIPAFFVNEDLRRLNMKEVEKSVYFYEQNLMN